MKMSIWHQYKNLVIITENAHLATIEIFVKIRKNATYLCEEKINR